MFNNLSTIEAEEFFKAFGYLLNMVSNNINILIWICWEAFSNKFNKGVCNSLIAPSKLISLISFERISFNILNISGFIKSLLVLET